MKTQNILVNMRECAENLQTALGRKDFEAAGRFLSEFEQFSEEFRTFASSGDVAHLQILKETLHDAQKAAGEYLSGMYERKNRISLQLKVLSAYSSAGNSAVFVSTAG